MDSTANLKKKKNFNKKNKTTLIILEVHSLQGKKNFFFINNKFSYSIILDS